MVSSLYFKYHTSWLLAATFIPLLVENGLWCDDIEKQAIFAPSFVIEQSLIRFFCCLPRLEPVFLYVLPGPALSALVAD